MLDILSFSRSAVPAVSRERRVSRNQPDLCRVCFSGRTVDRRVLPGSAPSGGGGNPILAIDLNSRLPAVVRHQERAIRSVNEVVSDRRAGWSNHPRLGDVDGASGIRPRCPEGGSRVPNRSFREGPS